EAVSDARSTAFWFGQRLSSATALDADTASTAISAKANARDSAPAGAERLRITKPAQNASLRNARPAHPSKDLRPTPPTGECVTGESKQRVALSSLGWWKGRGGNGARTRVPDFPLRVLESFYLADRRRRRRDANRVRHRREVQSLCAPHSVRAPG